MIKASMTLFDWFVKATELDEFDVRVRTAWHHLVAAYSQSHRYYHDLNHLHNLIQDHLDFQEDLTQERLLTIFYHDIYYAPKPGSPEASSNEELSARIFLVHAESILQLAPKLAAKVAAEIRLTEYKPSSQTIFGDFDFLGFALPRRKKSSRLLRCESPNLTDEEFRASAIKWFEALQKRPFYFQWSSKWRDLEKVARFYNDQELAALRDSYDAWDDWTQSEEPWVALM